MKGADSPSSLRVALQISVTLLGTIHWGGGGKARLFLLLETSTGRMRKFREGWAKTAGLAAKDRGWRDV